MAMRDPAEVAAKWARNTSAATADYTAGVDRVTEAPGRKAAAKVDKWRAGLQASEAKYVRNVGRVSLEEWRSAAKEKGAQRLAQGASQAQDKFAARIAPVLSHIETVRQAISTMDDTTLEGRIARSAEFQRRMAAYRSPGS